MRKFYLSIFSILTVVFLSGYAFGSCEGMGQKKYGTLDDYKTKAQPDRLKIVSYNLENLFDAIHDEGRDDYEFLPINSPEKEKCEFKTGYYKYICQTQDWTDERIDVKLNQIKKMIQVQGSLPDIFSVLEVENVNIVSQLANRLKYPRFLITSGSDKRIQLGLLYKTDKLELKETKEVVLTFPPGLNIKGTRNVLVANFYLKSNPQMILGVYVNHWPSQAAPSGARKEAAKAVKKTIDSFMKKYGAENYHAVVLGDFNTVEGESSNPFSVFLDESWAHKLSDMESLYRSEYYKYDEGSMISRLPPASYFYATKEQWNKLDHIFVSPNLLDLYGVESLPETFRIIAPQFALKSFEKGKCEFSAPMRYNHNQSDPDLAGFSDHFPIGVQIQM